MTKSILLVGVGGQGTILASKLLTIGLMEEGYDVKMSEIHGMAQRGGSVSSQVRYAEKGGKVESPVIELGDADILISFEKMEALRWLEYLKPEGRVVVNNLALDSLPILTGAAVYPKNAIDIIKATKVPVTLIDATKMAEEMGNVKVMNIIMLGTIVKSMKLENIDWEKIIRDNVKPAFIDLNIQAFKKGLTLV
jgi:indolepyruvate ferredoxin oxidoreductase beta subunit